MSSFVELLRRIGRADANVAVLGQGYVGLTLACAVAEAGHSVTGIDVDAERVRALGERPDAVPGVDPATVTRAIATGRLRFTTDVSAVGDAQIVGICVPTPLLDGAPDLRFVERAARDAAACLRPGTLVVLESTTYPGTTETVVRPILESGRPAERAGLPAGLLARADRPGERASSRCAPRPAAGRRLTRRVPTAAAVRSTSSSSTRCMPVSSTGAAETAKLLENTFRHVNIALVERDGRCSATRWRSTCGRSSTPRRRSRSASCRSTPGPASAGTASRSTPRTCPGRCDGGPVGASGCSRLRRT